MDFTTMGTLGSYLRQKNLNFAAKYKLSAGQKLTDSNGFLNFEKTQTADIKKKSEEDVSTAKIAGIKQKLSSGKKISDEELTYLQQREPKTYKRAKHAEEAREDLKGELKKAKTKQEAKQAVTQAMIKASAEASADIAACKSDSKSSDFSKSLNLNDKKNFTPIDGEFGEGCNAVNSNTNKIFKDAEFQNLDSDWNKFSWNNETEENSSDTEDDSFRDFYGIKHIEKNSADDSEKNNSETPQDIMESFIMTIRAIEAEWAQFTKSKEYDALPNNKIEEDLLNKLGRTKKNYKETSVPNAKMMGAATAYRTSMTYKNFQMMAEFE